VHTLFGEVAGKIADRPGGYTRIIKLSDVRVGDNAEMCLIELVDYNTLYSKESIAKKAKTRRSRRGKKADGTEESAEETTAQEAPAKEVKTEKKTKKSTTKKEKE
jgi:large subunit ribosomal protein L17